MNIPTSPPLVASDMMKKVRDDVARLLNHAIKQPNISIKAGFIEKTVPILTRDVKDLNSFDHVELWNANNHLSSLLSPVTAESLEVDEELNTRHNENNGKNRLQNLKWDLTVLVVWMGIFVLAVLLTQGYSIVMSDNTDRLSSLISEYTKIVDDETIARKASSDGIGDEKKEPLMSILANKRKLEVLVGTSANQQFSLNMLGWWCKQNTVNGSQSSTDNVETALQCGKSIELLLNSLVLPMLLGFLGAIAFITRNTLNHLTDSTFTPSWGGRYVMRTMLGGLLGVIGPWLYASGKVDEVGLGLSLFAFLLGYSVELAFSLFDKFINYAREKIKPGGEAKAASIEASAIADLPGTPPTPYVPTVPIVESAATEITNLRQQLESYRKGLVEIVELGPILEVITLPEYFQLECKPQIETAKDLLKQLDTYINSSVNDIAELAKISAQFNEQCKAVTGENHPITKLLRSATLSFSESSNNDSTASNSTFQSEAFIVTLFAGATAAFAKGPSAYERWLAYVWSQPFNARYISGLNLGGEDALGCLKLTTIFQMAFKEQAGDFAKTLLDLVANNQNLDNLAERLWQTPTELKGLSGDLTALFGSLDVFKEGWNEYGHCLLRYVVQKVDFPTDRFSEDETLLAVTQTLSIVDSFRQNQISEKDLDILCHLSLELMRRAQTSSTFDAVDLIRRSMTGGGTI